MLNECLTADLCFFQLSYWLHTVYVGLLHDLVLQSNSSVLPLLCPHHRHNPQHATPVQAIYCQVDHDSANVRVSCKDQPARHVHGVCFCYLASHHLQIQICLHIIHQPSVRCCLVGGSQVPDQLQQLEILPSENPPADCPIDHVVLHVIIMIFVSIMGRWGASGNPDIILGVASAIFTISLSSSR